jgi:hypothetical protein
MSTTHDDAIGSGEVELGSPRSAVERLFMIACRAAVAGVGLFVAVSAATSLAGTSAGRGLLTVAIGAFGLWLTWLGVRAPAASRGLRDRLYAGPDGVRAGTEGRDRYPWRDIGGFEVVPTAGSAGPRALMLLHDGRRLPLRALREVDDGAGNTTNPGAVEDGVRGLQRMLDEARAAEPSP